MLRVVIGDDQPSYGRGLELILRTDISGFDVMAISATFAELLEQVRLHRPDIVVLDPRMADPQDNALATLRCDFPEVRVVILTGTVDSRSASDALRFGASALLSKDLPVEAITEAFRIVALGQVVIPPSIVNLLDGSPPASAELTVEEVRLLKLVSSGMVVSEMAREMPMSESTVTRHLRLIQRKLNVNNRFEAAIHATRSGLI